MADRRGILFPLIILAFIFLTPDPAQRAPPPGHPLHRGPTLQDVIGEEQRSLGELQNSTYDARRFDNNEKGYGLNLTGFEPDAGFTWDALPKVQSRASDQLEYALGEKTAHALALDEELDIPLYRNVTGFVHGKWVRSRLEQNITAPALNLTGYATPGPFGPMVPHGFQRNVTGEEGDVRIHFHERQGELTTDGNATNIDIEITISDDSGAEQHELKMLGVYQPAVGQAILTTTSDKFAGIFALPHMALSEPIFESSRVLLNTSIEKAIQRQIDGETFRMNPWSSRLEGAVEPTVSAPKCELVIYLQQLPPITTTASTGSAVLSFLENELRFPTGASLFLPAAPQIRFSMLVLSPDCGYVLESKGPPDFIPQAGTHLIGPKIEVLYSSSRHHLLVFTCILALQLVLLIRQMREASTPSTRSRISLFTVAMLALGDGFTFLAFLLISFFVPGLWTDLVMTAFVAFMGVSFFGMRFLLDLWTVQLPEREAVARVEAERERVREERFQAEMRRLREQREARLAELARTNATADTTNAPPQEATTQPSVENQSAVPTTTNDTSTQQPPPPSSLPLPATAPRRPTDTGATPVFMPSDQEGLESTVLPTTTAPNQPSLLPTVAPTATPSPERLNTGSFGALYTRFYMLLIGSLFISLNATAWPASARRFYFTFLALCYLSFWIPQINRNVKRNCRKALKWEFVLGQSFLRLLPFGYFYGYRGNVLFAEVDYKGLAILAMWTWLQILMLVSQEIVGPRWFVPTTWTTWAPPAYDYHPVLRDDEEGATMPIGFSQATAAGSSPTSPTEARSKSSVELKRRDSISSASAKERQQKGRRVFDCAICMQDLEVPVVESGSANDNAVTGPAGLLARRSYMVTPCRHIFHSSCLEGWMKFRLQCPICREGLPPL